jgi:transposase-like protein
MSGKRKNWTSEDKLRIVLLGMQPGVEVSEVCRQEGLSAALYYMWKKQLLGSASKVFESKRGRKSHEEERREAEMQRLKNVVVELTTENLELKKGFSA